MAPSLRQICLFTAFVLMVFLLVSDVAAQGEWESHKLYPSSKRVSYSACFSALFVFSFSRAAWPGSPQANAHCSPPRMIATMVEAAAVRERRWSHHRALASEFAVFLLLLFVIFPCGASPGGYATRSSRRPASANFCTFVASSETRPARGECDAPTLTRKEKCCAEPTTPIGTAPPVCVSDNCNCCGATSWYTTPNPAGVWCERLGHKGFCFTGPTCPTDAGVEA
jgi:hypothetical protein